jgi:hypothetical protein
MRANICVHAVMVPSKVRQCCGQVLRVHPGDTGASEAVQRVLRGKQRGVSCEHRDRGAGGTLTGMVAPFPMPQMVPRTMRTLSSPSAYLQAPRCPRATEESSVQPQQSLIHIQRAVSTRNHLTFPRKQSKRRPIPVVHL